MSNIATSLLSVLCRTWYFRDGRTLRYRFLKQPLQKRSAPPATGSRSEALAQLSRPFRFFDTQEINDLAPGDMKAKTNFLIKLVHQIANQFVYSSISSSKFSGSGSRKTSGTCGNPSELLRFSATSPRYEVQLGTTVNRYRARLPWRGSMRRGMRFQNS